MKTKRNGHLAMFSVATLALVGAFLGQSILAPAQSVSADDTATTEITVRVNPIISIELEGADENNDLHLEVDRVNNQMVGTGDMSVKVTTNDPTGYSLYITTDKADTTLSRTDGVTDRVKAIPSAAASFPEGNYWGYKIGSTYGGDGLYHAVQSGNDTNLASLDGASVPIPTPAKTTNASATSDETVVTFGAQVKDSLPSGHYGNTVVFTALPNQSIVWAAEDTDDGE